ncbi:MAG: SDR family NAD(P)-dependent oxidoreductase [Polyangiaceae bacterium]
MSAVVTGAGQGIGRAIALALSARGSPVALLGRHVDPLRAVENEIEKRGGKAIAIACDVSKSVDVEAARDAVLSKLGAPRVVVNNAGVAHRVDLVSTPEEIWDETLDVNLKGAFLVARAFLPSMIQARNGRIVSISSISGTLGTKRMTAYCASKWGLVGLTKALAEETRGTGVQAMCVMPGSVDTAMLEGSGFSPEMTPEDVASLVAYAAFDAPPAMNGSAIDMFGA